MRRIRSLFALAILAVATVACNTEFNEITPTYAVPLISSKLGVYNLLAKVDSSFIERGNNGLITLVYGNDIFQLPSESVVKFTTQSMGTQATYTGPTLNPFNPGAPVEISQTVLLDFFGVTAEEIYKLLADSGLVRMELNSSIKHTINYEVTYENITVGSVPVKFTGNSVYQGANHVITDSRSLDGATIDFGLNNTNHNKIKLTYLIKIYGQGGNPLSVGENISLISTISGIKFDFVECYLGQQDISIPVDSIPINLFQFTNEEQTSQSGTFALTDPGVKIEIENAFTLPMNVNITKMALKREDTGQEDNVNLSGLQNPFSVQYPLVPGDVQTTSVVIDKSNSNLHTLITPERKFMIFKFDVNTNPGGKTGSPNKFAKSTELKVRANLNLPMAGYGYNWILSDTIELGFNFGNQENLKSGIIRLNIDNHFPLEADVQVYFLDENKNKKDSLFDNSVQFLKAPPIGAEGRVTGSELSTKDIPADNAKMKNITGSKYVAIYAKLKTPGSTGSNPVEVKIYEDNYIFVKMGIKAEISITKP